MPKEIEVILKDFVRHVVDLKAEEDPAGTGFHKEFRILRETQNQNKTEDRFSTEDGRKEENIKKNRYKDILPRDDRRVKLKEIKGEKGSDYINATFIEDVNGRNGYIAAQGPMPHTVNDFWRMLWEYNTEIVFMACRLKEDGRPKCEKYWPEKGDSATFGDITVHTENEEEIQDHFVRRCLRAEKDGKTLHLTQFHYTGWPDHNTPSSPDALRTMIEDVRDYRKKMDIPMVVHCSAGCGRTGTICAIDYGWTLLDQGMISDEFSMFEIIKSLREQRMSMVQTPDQYEYTHMVMKSLCNEWLASFASRDYENITIGTPAEESDEIYTNITCGADQSNGKESADSAKERVISIGEVPKETEKPTRSAKPSLADKPEEKQQKPDAGKTKPQAGAIIQTATSAHPKSIAIASPSLLDSEAGEYVEVRQTAPLSPSSPPVLPDKKNPPLNTAPLDPHKTIITIGGTATPKIIQTGSVGISAAKQQAPKPPVTQVFKAPTAAPATSVNQQQQQGQRKQQQAASDTVYGQVMKKTTMTTNRQASTVEYENFPSPLHGAGTSSDQNASNLNNGVSVSVSKTESAPDLPERLYKPEEITISSSPSAKHPYDNVEVSTSPQSKAPPSTGTIQNRSSQPLPASQPSPRPGVAPATPHQSAGHQVQMTSPGHKGQTMTPYHLPGHKGQVTSPQPAGQAIPGMVSAMGGRQHPIPMMRRKSAKSAGGHPTQPVTVMPGYPRGGAGGPVVVQARQPQSAGVKSQPMVVVGAKGKHVFYTDRPPRPRGPRAMPPGWTTISKNQRGTYL